MPAETPKDGEYWVVEIHGRLPKNMLVEREVALVSGVRVLTCGDDEGWHVTLDRVRFVRKVELP